MDITNPQRAKVLVHALPYIQEYSGKIVVIKYGGNAMISDKLKDSVMRDIVLLSLIGVKVVLVHGGGPEITETLEQLGKQTQFVDGLRVTDAETADVVQMVLAGKINKTLVNPHRPQGRPGDRPVGHRRADDPGARARRTPRLRGRDHEGRRAPHPRRDRQGLHPRRVHRRVRHAGPCLQHQRRHGGRAHRGRAGCREPHRHDRHQRHPARQGRPPPRSSPSSTRRTRCSSWSPASSTAACCRR